MFIVPRGPYFSGKERVWLVEKCLLHCPHPPFPKPPPRYSIENERNPTQKKTMGNSNVIATSLPYPMYLAPKWHTCASACRN